ncbi:hypothetical protein DFH09DRAFT_144357 [Mycena vulgaris]|nr:hypothetical protein DFH09DRAFT_144357 [Mycena vulgaris]
MNAQSLYPNSPWNAIPTYIPLGNSDAAQSRVWAIYLAEAEKYDKALVESWRDGVTGILIFAGLFSAIVTAFIIDSYKTLLGNSGDITVQLLTQISLQLAEISRGNNSSVLLVSTPPQFVPSTPALACNIFWFTSLGLSLTCALIATLLGQWAQNFLHRAELRSGVPVVAARIMSYLYYGIRRFDMHTVVVVIPLLLHASLFFFFAGLVAFLIPVNLVVMGLCSGILFIFMMVYLAFTILPLCYLDCPYRTPLSGALWHATAWYRRILRSQFRRNPVTPDVSAHDVSMVEAMMRRATADSEERATRDYRALRWMVKSLIDNKALQAFVDCIPGLLQDDQSVKNRTQHRYKDHIKALVYDPDIQLCVRIEGMLRKPIMGVADSDSPAGKHLSMCFQAMWAIAKLDPTLPIITDAQLIEEAYVPNSYSRHRHVDLLPLVTIARNRAFSALDLEMAEAIRYLETCRAGIASWRLMNMKSVIDCLIKMRSGTFDYPDSEAFDELLGSYRVGAPAWIEQATAFIQRFRTDVPYFMLFRYLTYVVRLPVNEASAVPEHEYTCSSFQLSSGPLSSTVEVQLEHAFNTLTAGRVRVNFSQTILRHLATLLNWRVPPYPNRIRPFILQYLIESTEEQFHQIVDPLGHAFLWSVIPSQLTAPDTPYYRILVRLCYFTQFKLRDWSAASLGFTPYLYGPALSAAENLRPSSSSAILITLIKSIILLSFKEAIPQDKSGCIAALDNPQLPSGILPTETAVTVPEDFRIEPVDDRVLQEQCARLSDAVSARCDEAFVRILAEFVDSCAESPSQEAAEALSSLPALTPTVGRVHAVHQRRLANSIHHLFRLESTESVVFRLQEEVEHFNLLLDHNLSWLDDPEAEKMVTEALQQRRNIPDTSPIPFQTGLPHQQRGMASSDDSGTNRDKFAPPRMPGPVVFM